MRGEKEPLLFVNVCNRLHHCVVVFKKFSNPSILSRAPFFFSLRQEAHRLFVSVASIVAIKSPFVAFRVKMKTLRKRIRVARLTLSWANNGKNWDPRFDEWRLVGIWIKNWEWKDIKKRCYEWRRGFGQFLLEEMNGKRLRPSICTATSNTWKNYWGYMLGDTSKVFGCFLLPYYGRCKNILRYNVVYRYRVTLSFS